MDLDRAKLTVRRSYETYATGDVAVLDDVIAEGYVDHNPVPGQGAGRVGVRDKVLATRGMLSDITVRFEDQVAEGDRVASRITIEGVDPDGNAVTARLFAISQLESGQIIAEWGVADMSGA